jgi:plasmid stabilization system protein ParE
MQPSCEREWRKLVAEVGYTSAALEDIRDHFAYHSDYSDASAMRFADQVEAVAKRLEQFPRAGRVRTELGERIRMVPVPTLKLVWYYRLVSDVHVEIVRVLRQERGVQGTDLT